MREYRDFAWGLPCRERPLTCSRSHRAFCRSPGTGGRELDTGGPPKLTSWKQRDRPPAGWSGGSERTLSGPCQRQRGSSQGGREEATLLSQKWGSQRTPAGVGVGRPRPPQAPPSATAPPPAPPPPSPQGPGLAPALASRPRSRPRPHPRAAASPGASPAPRLR